MCSWKPPLDDGGSEITSYIVEKMDMENMRWVPCGESAGTSLRVDHLIEGHDYKFRVKGIIPIYVLANQIISAFNQLNNASLLKLNH